MIAFSHNRQIASAFKAIKKPKRKNTSAQTHLEIFKISI